MRRQTSRAVATALLVLLTCTVLSIAVASPAAAEDAPATPLTVAGPVTARIGGSATVTAVLADEGGLAVTGATVVLEQQGNDGHWTASGSAVTNPDGAASFTPDVSEGGLIVRARFAGDQQHAASVSEPITITAVVVDTHLNIYGPRKLVDETAGHVTTRWTGSDGLPVIGAVTVYQHGKGRPWSRLGTTVTDRNGRVEVPIRPRVDMTYQFRGINGRGWHHANSVSWTVDNLPPGKVVSLPSKAPRPRVLPAQRRAVGGGANPRFSTLPDIVWKRMVGRSWHTGCPVGRSGLRYLQVNYWGFDGYRHRGELIVRASAASHYSGALKALYAKKVPIRYMYLPDRFGYSGRSAGANDYASMRHDNTSAYNCRKVTGGDGERSPHSWGTSIDLNPWENPYHSGVGWLPTSWWSKVQLGLVAWRTSSHPVVAAMRANGFRWTYGRSDPQHFDTTQ